MTDRFETDSERRRDELLRQIENSVEHLTLPELEALHYDMISKGYIHV